MQYTTKGKRRNKEVQRTGEKGGKDRENLAEDFKTFYRNIWGEIKETNFLSPELAHHKMSETLTVGAVHKS